MFVRLLLSVAALAALLPAVACEDEERQTLTVFADSSLTEAFEALGQAFESANPGVELDFTFASSAELARRLQDGAAADLVAAADLRTMTGLAEAGLTGESIELTTNNMVVVMREGLEGLSSFEELSRDGLAIAVADAEDPAGRYAREALERAAAEYGGEWKATVLENIEAEEPDVREVLERIKDGEADAGFVYLSDLTPLGHDVALGLLPLPARLALGIVYPAALTAKPAEVVLAQAFLDFMVSDDGQAIIESFGFGANQ